MTRKGAILIGLTAIVIGGIFAAKDYFKYTQFSQTMIMVKFFEDDRPFSDPHLVIGSWYGMGNIDEENLLDAWYCFSNTDLAQFAFAAPMPEALPRPGPIWLGCYDADKIATDLANGSAKAYALQTFTDPTIVYVAAVYPDGQGAVWRQMLKKPLVRPVVQP